MKTNASALSINHRQPAQYAQVEWCFTLLSILFQSYHSDSSHFLCLSWVSPILGWRGHSQKNLRFPCGSKPRTPVLRVKHFTNEPLQTKLLDLQLGSANSINFSGSYTLQRFNFNGYMFFFGLAFYTNDDLATVFNSYVPRPGGSVVSVSGS